MPTLSVTVIGLVIATIALTVGRKGVVGTLLRGLVGSWLGFVAGAMTGVILDILLHQGFFLAALGHGVAVSGAVMAVWWHFPQARLGRAASARDLLTPTGKHGLDDKGVSSSNGAS